MATRNLGEDILTLDNELIAADETGGEDALPSEPGVLLLREELPPDPPVRKVEVFPRRRSGSATSMSSNDAPARGEEAPRSTPNLAWSAPEVDRRTEIARQPSDTPPNALEAAIADARKLAAFYHFVEARSRNALYDAIGCAHDLSIIARRFPVEYSQTLRKAEIDVADRAPLVALVKLVFGKDYDKTRLSEFATVIAHCQRKELERGAAAKYLAESPGGIRRIVAMERLHRHGEDGIDIPAERTEPRKTIARKLAKVPSHGMEILEGAGDEFVLVIARRDPQGGATLVGEVPRDIPLLEKAARKFLAEGTR